MEQQDLNFIKTQLESASKIIDKDISLEKKDLLELENTAKERFNKSIGGYVEHPKYAWIGEYLKIITNGQSKINSLIIEGEQGLGKSTIVKSILKKLKKEICYINSYTTSLSFYKTLYLNRFNHIVLDDVFGIFNDERGIAILRAITNTESVRYVKYESTSDKLDVPSNFVFEGSVTILTNNLTPYMNESLLNRAIHRKLYFSLKEKFDFMDKIAKFNYPDVDTKEIMAFIKDNVDETTRNFTFRSVIKIIEFYLNNKDNWKKMAYEELEKDEELIFVKEIMFLNIERRNQRWIEETGKSIRTLQRKIKDLEIKRQDDIKTEMKGGIEKWIKVY